MTSSLLHQLLNYICRESYGAKNILPLHFNNGEPAPACNRRAPSPSTMPAKLGASPLLSPEAAHAQLPGADALASAFSGLESATTEWPDLEMWPTAPAALDAGWDEVMAPWPREDALTKARSAESLAAVEGAPTCGQTCHPPTGRPDPAHRDCC